MILHLPWQKLFSLRLQLWHMPLYFAHFNSGHTSGLSSMRYLSIGYSLESWLRLFQGLLFLISSEMFSILYTSWFCNKYLRQYTAHSVEQEVEWLYAFDVHCNAFLCAFMLTYIFQVDAPHTWISFWNYFSSSTLLFPYSWVKLCYLVSWPIPCMPLQLYGMPTSLIWDTEVIISSNSFSSYNSTKIALPFLGNTQVFLWYPVLFAVFLWITSMILLIVGLRFNLTRISMFFHFA